MKMLGNSTRGLLPYQKRLLYRTCILPITLYRFPLWFYNKVPLSYPLNKLNTIQWRAVIWILEAFCISPIMGIEAIASLISIQAYLQKLSGKNQLQTSSLSHGHTLKALLERRFSPLLFLHCFSLECMTSKQQ